MCTPLKRLVLACCTAAQPLVPSRVPKAPEPYLKEPDIQYCNYKGNYLHCGSCIGLLLGLCQTTNHKQSSHNALYKACVYAIATCNA